MKTFGARGSLLLALLGFSLPAPAARLASFCTMNSQQRIEGRNILERRPIASVSKLMTTWWSLSEGGPGYRFPTVFHVTPVEPGRFDVHLEGSRDPYFGLRSLHFAISELNRRGIKKVRRFTFDENFKFYVNVTSDAVAASHYTSRSPKPETVLAQLKSLGSLTNGWRGSLEAARRNGTPLLGSAEFSVAEIAFQAREDFAPAELTRRLTMKSSPLLPLLKEMNRNSNNHAANQIFEHFGGAAVFEKFSSRALNLSASELLMWNGSGDRVDTESGPRYNEATCEAVLKVISDLRSRLRLLGKDLQHVMALSGENADSTVNKIYRNETTEKSLIGKTGTVNPSVSLAGLVRTKQGEYAFMYNVETNGSRSDWNTARRLIRNEITELIRSRNGGEPISYKAFEFLSVDAHSIFERDPGQPDDLQGWVTNIPIPIPRPAMP